MNKRIKQILLQVVPMVGEDGEYLPSLHTPQDIERFAELIVRECADICRDDGRWFQEQDDKVEAGVSYALAYKIEERFGVEE